MIEAWNAMILEFLSTPSARRATIQTRPREIHRHISIHALREEGDEYDPDNVLHFVLFLSTPSARRATGCLGKSTRRKGNFYPRPPRGGRRPSATTCKEAL